MMAKGSPNGKRSSDPRPPAGSAPLPGWLVPDKGGVILNLRIQPRASRSGIVGELGDALKLRIAAPPVDNKANQEVVSFLCGLLDLPRSAVAITHGKSSRMKHVHISLAPEQVLERMKGEG